MSIFCVRSISVAPSIASKSEVTTLNVTQGDIPMNTPITTTGNNAQIFADYAAMQHADHVTKEILGTYAIIGLNNPTVVRERSVIINDQSGEGFTLQREAECRGALTALIDGFHIAKYKVLNVGLHLFKTAEELRTLPAATSVGYLTSSYNGDDARLLEIKPTAGVATLNWFGGSFRVADVVKEAPKERFDESDYTTKMRRIYYKHTAMDMILLGMKILVFPKFLVQVDGTPGTKTFSRNEAREIAFLKGYTKNFDLTPAQAIQNSNNAAFVRQTRRIVGQIDSAVNAGTIAIPLDQSVFVGSERVNIASLFGKRVSKMRGTTRIMDVTVTPANAAQLLVEARDLKLTFIVQ
jgi:hypothetical protein